MNVFVAGPLAEIEGYAAPAPPAPARAMSPQMTGPPPLTPADKAKFGRIFAGCGPVNGLVTGTLMSHWYSRRKADDVHSQARRRETSS
jgi:hypothetical protein